MGCDSVELLLSRRLDGEALTPDQARAISQHLSECSDCRALDAGWQEDDRVLGRAFAAIQVTDQVSATRQAASILNRLAREEARRRPRVLSLKGVSLSAAAAGLILGVALAAMWASVQGAGLRAELARAMRLNQDLTGQMTTLRREAARGRPNRSWPGRAAEGDAVPGAQPHLLPEESGRRGWEPPASFPAARLTPEEFRREVDRLVRAGDLKGLDALRDRMPDDPTLARFLIDLSRQRMDSPMLRAKLASLIGASKGPDALRFLEEELAQQIQPGAVQDRIYQRALLDGLAQHPNERSTELLRRFWESGPDQAVRRGIVNNLEGIDTNEANRLLMDMARRDASGDQYSVRNKALELLISRSQGSPLLQQDENFLELLLETGSHAGDPLWDDASYRALEFLQMSQRGNSRVRQLFHDLQRQTPQGNIWWDYFREALREF